MPLLTDPTLEAQQSAKATAEKRPTPVRKQSTHSQIARSVIMNNASTINTNKPQTTDNKQPKQDSLALPVRTANGKAPEAPGKGGDGKARPAPHRETLGTALTDTPSPSAPSTAPGSPRIRPTTLDIPGLTRSKASPDGRISQRDIGAKLVIVMVGLPARGKSYITKKVARYLNWLQHDTRIFNVGTRRREVAHEPGLLTTTPGQVGSRPFDFGYSSTNNKNGPLDAAAINAKILINGEAASLLPTLDIGAAHAAVAQEPELEMMDQSADFFDPENTRASIIREQVAMATLDELLDYVLDEGGAVGILDATNSTLARRKAIVNRVRERAGPELNVLFLESLCVDQQLLESNMRLKLSGPDYKDQDPVASLNDFRKRVELYEKSYIPLGEYEEKNGMQYVQMIDVGRKVVSHRIRGFLAGQTVYYLLNFNLAPRQIWITRHGESIDNVRGKIGGDSPLSENGKRYARALTRFIGEQRKLWDIRQRDKAAQTHFPPLPGDTTPPNPQYVGAEGEAEEGEKSFCVWTSMLQRSIQTAAFFDEEDFDIKQMRMLDELNAGQMDGMTYEEIKHKHKDEYELRRHDKLHYRYPGQGGEGYLDIINRLRAVIVEVERMTDHVLLVGHRSVVRVLLAYFKGLKREDVADLDAPLGVLYMLEPKPYGVEFKAYRYNAQTDGFDYVPHFELRRSTSQGN